MIVSQKDWRLVRPALAEAGFRVVSVDTPGHGESPKPADPSAYKPEAMLDALEGWINQMAGGEQLHLVGHSLGGFMCLGYCLRNPERVKRLALIDPFCYPDQIVPAMQPLAKLLDKAKWLKQNTPDWLVNELLRWDQLVLGGISPEDRRQIAKDLKRTTPHILNLLGDLPDMRSKLGMLKPPTLMMWGERDTLLSPSSFPWMAGQIPNAELCPVKHARHVPQLSHPKEVSEALVAFFSKE
jgi:3-oxoadipate enol-lactonase